jgi:hypothetical protein
MGNRPASDGTLTKVAGPILAHLLAERERIEEERDQHRRQQAHFARPWKAGDQLASYGNEEGPFWTVLSVRGEWVTLRKGSEKPIRRKILRHASQRLIQVGSTTLVRRGRAA